MGESIRSADIFAAIGAATTFDYVEAMMTKTLVLREEARDALRRGVETVARAAKVTMGPRGHHVIIQRDAGPPFATKDGVTVVQEIELEEPCENLGALLIRQAASTTAEAAGEGDCGGRRCGTLACGTARCCESC